MSTEKTGRNQSTFRKFIFSSIKDILQIQINTIIPNKTKIENDHYFILGRNQECSQA